MTGEVSTFRLYLMRAGYLLIFVGLGLSIWPELIDHQGTWDPVYGIAYSFWGALSVLAGLGLRYPLQMLPLLLLQLVYKSVWLVAVALPLWSAGALDANASRLIEVCSMGVVLDLIIIPWPYVLANYVRKPGNRWRSTRTVE